MSEVRKRGVASTTPAAAAAAAASPLPPVVDKSAKSRANNARIHRAVRIIFNCALLSLTTYVCFTRVPTTQDVFNLAERLGIKQRAQNAHSNYGVTVFSKEELSHYDSESEKTYVAVMGRVFDVSSGKYYKKDGGYGFFAGRDASRAYVTGDFEEAGLTDFVEDFDDLQRQELVKWLNFYENSDDYPFIGVLAGPFYDKAGQPTDELEQVERGAERAVKSLELQKEQESKIPTCSSRGVKGKGSIVSCKEPRVPRKLQLPAVDGLVAHISKRCACVLPKELEQLEVEEYEGCDPGSQSCELPKSAKQQRNESL